MKRKLQGKYVKTTTVGETVKAFVPAPLPPRPDIDWSTDLRQRFEQAHLALGRLDSIASLLPDMQLFLYMYVRKEAVLSSMIEGTQSSLSDLLIYELEQKPGVPLDDVQEVSNYVAALHHGLILGDFDQRGQPAGFRPRIVIVADHAEREGGDSRDNGDYRHDDEDFDKRKAR